MSTEGIQLIVGLGNPGPDYEDTRHNAGAWFVNDLALSSHMTFRHETKLHGLHCIVRVAQQDVHLLIPTTFMNLSGQAVKATANYYKIPTNAILVAHDEIDLPTGDIRLKFDGGHGGHNGLRDIIRHLNTNQFHRLRIGVGRPLHSNQVVDYVLKPPKKSEREEIDTALQEANRVLPQLISGQFQQAMQDLHTRE